MKTLITESYQCEICRQIYESADAARTCEAKPVTYNRGVKIGDEVLITAGDGRGLRCKVESVGIHDKDWGHYAAKRYWHTVYLNGVVADSWGYRQLSYDQYETISAEKSAL